MEKSTKTELSLSDIIDKYKRMAESVSSVAPERANEYRAIWAWLVELRNRRMEEDMEGCYEQLKNHKQD